jgi:predicted nuclease of predicted toxin-antitoxin system
MKVLIDECAPFELKSFLADHGIECATVPEAGWSGISNGELLRLANRQFDAFVTIDATLRYQQNLSGLNMAIVVVLPE